MINPTTAKAIDEAATNCATNEMAIIKRVPVFTVDKHLGNPQQYENVAIFNPEAKMSYSKGATDFYSKGQQDMRNLILGMLRSGEDQRLDSACGQADWLESELKKLDGVENDPTLKA